MHRLALVPGPRAGAAHLEVVGQRAAVSEPGGGGQRARDDFGHGGAADVPGAYEDDAVRLGAERPRGDDEAAGAGSGRFVAAHCDLAGAAYSSRSDFLTILPVPARG